MITDAADLRHVTAWSRSPAFELSMLTPRPAPSGAAILEAGVRGFGLRGFWSRPRNLRGEPTTTSLAAPDDYPVVAIAPRSDVPGALVGVNILAVDPAPGIGESHAELVIFSPYDVFELCWEAQFLTSSNEQVAPAYRAFAQWAAALRRPLGVEHATMGFEGSTFDWTASATESDLERQSGVWMPIDIAAALGWSASGEQRGRLAIVPWDELIRDAD